MENNDAKTFYAYMSDSFPINLIEGGISDAETEYYDMTEKSPYYIFEYIAEGRGFLCAADKTIRVKKGEMYILPKNLSYECFSDYGESYVRYWFFGYGKLLDTLYELYSDKKPYLLAETDFSGDFQKIFEIMQSYDNTNESYMALSSALFNLITNAKLHEVAKEGIKTINPVSNNQAGKIKSYIFSNCAAKFSLIELSKAVSLSKNQLISVFKKAYGITPQVFHMMQKLEFAERMLKKGKNCREVAEYFNFCDEQYFTKMFKKYKGYAPGKIVTHSK